MEEWQLLLKEEYNIKQMQATGMVMPNRITMLRVHSLRPTLPEIRSMTDSN